MIYISWDVECDRLKLIIMGNFLPFYSPPPSLKLKKFEFWKKSRKLLEISSFYTCAPKTTIIWGKVPEIQSETDIIFCNFGYFLSFDPIPSPDNFNNQNFKNTKKASGTSSFYTCVPKITIIWCMLPETSF